MYPARNSIAAIFLVEYVAMNLTMAMAQGLPAFGRDGIVRLDERGRKGPSLAPGAASA